MREPGDGLRVRERVACRGDGGVRAERRFHGEREVLGDGSVGRDGGVGDDNAFAGGEDGIRALPGVAFLVRGERHGSAENSETAHYATEERGGSEQLGGGGGGDQEATQIAKREGAGEKAQIETIAQADEQTGTVERLVDVLVLEGGSVDAHAARA